MFSKVRVESADTKSTERERERDAKPGEQNELKHNTSIVLNKRAGSFYTLNAV